MKRMRIAVVLAALACLAATAAFAAEAGTEPAKDWSKILYWQTPGANAPMPTPEPVAEEAPAVPAAQSVQKVPGAVAIQANDAALEAGVTVVQQSYFTDALLLTKRDELTGATQTAMLSDADLSGDYVPKAGETSGAPQTDPWENFNRAMFDFNDTMYFWVFKPVSTGYAILIPQPARVGVANVYENVVRFPIRFANNLLQGKLENSFRELLKFLVNTVFGLGGLVESSRDHAYLNPPKQDLGKTFRTWGIGQGNYVVWPIFGSYTLRDTFGDIGDEFFWPPTYIRPWYWSAIIWTHEKTNLLSLRLGDYEALKEASLDPYIALRDAYLQYRNKKDFDPYYDKPEDKPKQEGYVPIMRVE